MRITLALVGVLAAAALTAHPASGQNQDPAALKREIDLLKRENDLLKRENDLLKRENDLLKQELTAIKKGGGKTAPGGDTDAPIRVTVDDVEYVYKGMTRNGPELLVTLLATSKSGEKRPQMGSMTLIDDEGNKYTGLSQGGFGAQQVLREGVPVKLIWRFGPSPFTKQGTAPPAKITSFKSLSVETFQPGATTIEFRDVPVTLPTPKKK